MSKILWWPVLAVALAGCLSSAAEPIRIDDEFEGPDELIAAEHHAAAEGSPWVMTSGSLFRAGGTGWSGVPDAGVQPGSTGSAVFRMVSTAREFRDVDLRMDLRIDSLTETTRTPARDYDGVHVWVRYRSDKELYAVSVDRRDGSMVIKKKCPGGESNGGTYHDLAPPSTGAPIPFGKWQTISVSVRDQPDGSVAITGSRDGHVIEATDTGIGCPALTGGGGVGVRGDNADFRMARVTVD